MFFDSVKKKVLFLFFFEKITNYILKYIAGLVNINFENKFKFINCYFLGYVSYHWLRIWKTILMNNSLLNIVTNPVFLIGVLI